MPDPVATNPMPRRGRFFVLAIIAISAVVFSVVVYELSTREAGSDVIRVDGIERSQAIFGGMPQAGDRLGSADAPVSIQVFTDMQCGNCRDDFLATIPGLAENYARPGTAKLLMRHYSVARNELELGFFGAEAAAQQGFGWQYTYLFFRNQEEAKRFGIGDRLLESLAASIQALDIEEWRDYLETEGGADGAIAARLEGYEELGTELGIRADVAMVINGPGGTRVLQDGPTLAQVERAIDAVD